MFFFTSRLPSRPALFPYTTLFRSAIGDADQELRDRWGEAINRFFFGSIARFGMFNADPHPGNYLFHDDGTVTFLDFEIGEHTSELQSHSDLVCRLLLEKKKPKTRR